MVHYPIGEVTKETAQLFIVEALAAAADAIAMYGLTAGLPEEVYYAEVDALGHKQAEFGEKYGFEIPED